MQQGNFINIFLARHVPGTYAHHQEHQILSCSIWFSAPSFWMGAGLESRCVGRVYGADVAVRVACRAKNKRQRSPVTGLEWPRGFQEVKVPRFHKNGTGWW